MNLPPLPYTEAIRKLDDRRLEWVYSHDTDFADPEKFGWERVYAADQLREYAVTATMVSATRIDNLEAASRQALEDKK